MIELWRLFGYAILVAVLFIIGLTMAAQIVGY